MTFLIFQITLPIVCRKLYWLLVFVFEILLMQSPNGIGQLSAVICIAVFLETLFWISALYVGWLNIDYFMVGERVRFLFTSCEE